MSAVIPPSASAMATATSARQQTVGGEEQQAGGDRPGEAAVARQQPAVTHAEERQIEGGPREDLRRVQQQGIDEITRDRGRGRQRGGHGAGPATVRAREEARAEE